MQLGPGEVQIVKGPDRAFYTTGNQRDAQLAHAAVEEALRGSALDFNREAADGCREECEGSHACASP